MNEFNELLEYLKGIPKVTNVFVKHLAPNDNSKNQPYLGGSFDVLSVLPMGELRNERSSVSQKPIYKASLLFSWLNDDGSLSRAPNAQVILYPQYPEVRLSGFLKGCTNAPSALMNERTSNRILLMATTSDNQIIAKTLGDASPKLIEAIPSLFPQLFGALRQAWKASNTQFNTLVELLSKIHDRGWVKSCRLNSQGEMIDYSAMNGGGYTLEALLGITPNGYSQPDLMGWEIKQHDVKDFLNPSHGPITLMTPEPTAGIYHDIGVPAFLKIYGYPDKNGIKNRINFGGIYKTTSPPKNSMLKLSLLGYDQNQQKIIDPDGGIALVDRISEEVAAKWGFHTIIDHWLRKHFQTIFIPSERTIIENHYYYRFGGNVKVGRSAGLTHLLNGIENDLIYLDPAIKMETPDYGNIKIKRRNQFRIQFKNLGCIFDSFNDIPLKQ